MMEVRIARGIEVAMITVLRQLPRKARIMKAVRHAAISVSLTTPLIAPRTKWIDPLAALYRAAMEPWS